VLRKGDLVQVVARTSFHEFRIGEVVEYIGDELGANIFRNEEGDTWGLDTSEWTPVERRIEEPMLQIGDLVRVRELGFYEKYTNIRVGDLATVTGTWSHLQTGEYGCDVVFHNFELEIDEDRVELNSDGSWAILASQLELV